MVHGLRNKYRKFYRRNAKHFQDGIPDGVMRKEIKQLLDTLPNSDDKKVCMFCFNDKSPNAFFFLSQAFDAEMQRFLSLFSRYERMTDLCVQLTTRQPWILFILYLKGLGTGQASSRGANRAIRPTPYLDRSLIAQETSRTKSEWGSRHLNGSVPLAPHSRSLES